ncbi:MAG: hypothetical protein GY746_00150 [Gammaproteobacteria bacterium]|nr:hypothetical protein [Gammaproteobacteria bacterium]MCP4488155.1 hypothetical protein [Gammaproteobacteria bacterium]
MKIAICSILSILFSNIHGLCLDSETAWMLHSFGLQVVILIWIWCAFSEYNKRKVATRSILAILLIWQAIEVVTYPIWWIYGMNVADFVWSTWAMTTVLWITYVLFRPYDYTSDKINIGNVHICLWRPRNDKSVILSTCGAPFGSVAIYAYDRLWSYRWDSGTFEERDISNPEALEKHYTIVDTGVSECDEIESALIDIVGTPARRWQALGMRLSCVSVLVPVLKLIGKDFVPNIFEHIPSLYAHKITRPKDQ